MLDFIADPAFVAALPRFITPILLAALGGAICERAGVFNVALEGFVLVGAFAAVAGSYYFASAAAGVLVAMASGVVMGLLFAEFHLRKPGDPIIVSIALNLLAIGLTTYLVRTLFGVSGFFRDAGIIGLGTVHVPLLDRVPVIGLFLNDQSVIFYFAVVAALLSHFFFARHRLGLRIRAAGQNPAALAAGGVNPAVVRLYALCICGALCGLAGAQLSIANVSLFVENMSAGRGWIAVVAVLLTQGRPLPLIAVVFLFGFVDSLSFRIQGLGFPQQFTDMMPYVTALVILIALSWWRSRSGKSLINGA